MYKKLMSGVLGRLAADERGATAIEYGLIMAIVAVGIIASLETLPPKLNAIFTSFVAYL